MKNKTAPKRFMYKNRIEPFCSCRGLKTIFNCSGLYKSAITLYYTRITRFGAVKI